MDRLLMAVKKRPERALRSTWTRQKEQGKTIEEASGCVWPQRVNKWPNSMLEYVDGNVGYFPASRNPGGR
jgi:hypothetical protein